MAAFDKFSSRVLLLLKLFRSFENKEELCFRVCYFPSVFHAKLGITIIVIRMARVIYHIKTIETMLDLSRENLVLLEFK